MTRTGDLDQKVQIVGTTETEDGEGGYETSTGPIGTVWAQVKAIRGQERELADRLAGEQTYRVTARNSGHWANLATDQTLIWGGIELNVKSAPNVGRGKYRTVEAVAGVVNS